MTRIKYAGRSDIGRVRTNNEDRWAADPQQGLYVVADGMGGQQAGEVASRLVVETLPSFVRQRLGPTADLTTPAAAEHVQAALAGLSSLLRQRSQNRLELRGMGSTVVLALVRPGQALIGHLGDSRAYRWRAGSLERLTRDHTLVQLLVDDGDITEAAAAHHLARNQLIRYMGMDGDALPDIRRVDLEPGDRLLLCSDGLSGMVPDERLAALLNQQTSPKSLCRSLIAAANDAGGQDNITVVLVAYD